MISTSFDLKFGAGAAASSARLRDSLVSAGHTVETFSLDNYKRNGTESSEQPIKGSEIPMWISLGSTAISQLVIRDVNQFKPDCIVLGSVDRSILGTVDILKLDFPIVWIAKGQSCSYRRVLVQTRARSNRTCAERSAQLCPAPDVQRATRPGARNARSSRMTREQALIAASYTLKSMVYRRRPDIVFCAISEWLKNELENFTFDKPA